MVRLDLVVEERGEQRNENEAQGAHWRSNYRFGPPQFKSAPKENFGASGTKPMPAIYPTELCTDAGGLMYYGANDPDLFRRVAIFVDNFLKGAKPTDLPVEQQKKFEFVINLKTAKQIALTIPPNVLARADKVIK